MEEYGLITFNQLRAIIKNIKTNVTCPACDENFSNDNIAVVSSARNKCAIVAQCRTCGTPILVTINIHRKQGEDSAEIMVHDETSLAAGEAEGEVPVNANPSIEPVIGESDVVAVHDFLQDFGGDFQTLFTGEGGKDKGKGSKKRRKGSEK